MMVISTIEREMICVCVVPKGYNKTKDEIKEDYNKGLLTTYTGMNESNELLTKEDDLISITGLFTLMECKEIYTISKVTKKMYEEIIYEKEKEAIKTGEYYGHEPTMFLNYKGSDGMDNLREILDIVTNREHVEVRMDIDMCLGIDDINKEYLRLLSELLEINQEENKFRITMRYWEDIEDVTLINKILDNKELFEEDIIDYIQYKLPNTKDKLLKELTNKSVRDVKTYYKNGLIDEKDILDNVSKETMLEIIKDRMEDY